MHQADPTFLPVFRKECTTCAHLVKHAKAALDECHYTKGNDACPAKTIYIGVGVKNMEKASTGIANAIINGDVVALARMANQLAKYEPEETQKVLAMVRELCLNSYGVGVDANGDVYLEEEDDDSEVEVEEGEEAEEAVDEDAVDEEGPSSADFDEDVLIALIDSRVTLLLERHGLVPKEATALELPPLNSGVSVEVAPQTTTDVPVQSTTETPLKPDTEDDWSEG